MAGISLPHGTFTFNGIASDTKGVYVSTFPSYSVPAKNLETYQIPGRNGNVIYDDGTYQNVDISYDVSIYQPSEASLAAAIRKVVTWLHPTTNDYCILSDTYYPSYYRLAICKNAFDVGNLLQTVGTAKIVFNCRPERFSSVNNKFTVNNTTVSKTNSQGFTSCPSFKATGPQTITINESDLSKKVVITIANGVGSSTVVNIDGETLNATNNSGVSLNAYVSANAIPRLYPGTNTIKSTGSVEVDPRWWVL